MEVVVIINTVGLLSVIGFLMYDIRQARKQVQESLNMVLLAHKSKDAEDYVRAGIAQSNHQRQIILEEEASEAPKEPESDAGRAGTIKFYDPVAQRERVLEPIFAGDQIHTQE
jgi:hypothetical protein